MRPQGLYKTLFMSDVLTQDQEWLDTEEAARVFKIDRRTLANWRYRHVGPPYFKAGPKRVLYSRTAVEAWLRQQAVQPADR